MIENGRIRIEDAFDNAIARYRALYKEADGRRKEILKMVIDAIKSGGDIVENFANLL